MDLVEQHLRGATAELAHLTAFEPGNASDLRAKLKALLLLPRTNAAASAKPHGSCRAAVDLVRHRQTAARSTRRRMVSTLAPLPPAAVRAR